MTVVSERLVQIEQERNEIYRKLDALSQERIRLEREDIALETQIKAGIEVLKQHRYSYLTVPHRELIIKLLTRKS